MKLKRISFYAIFHDGLVQLSGHEFTTGGRRLVVHKTRPILLPVDKFYKISEASAGFAVPIKNTKVRAEAVLFAADAMGAISDEEWSRYVANALALRRSLKIVQG